MSDNPALYFSSTISFFRQIAITNAPRVFFTTDFSPLGGGSGVGGGTFVYADLSWWGAAAERNRSGAYRLRRWAWPMDGPAARRQSPFKLFPAHRVNSCWLRRSRAAAVSRPPRYAAARQKSDSCAARAAHYARYAPRHRRARAYDIVTCMRAAGRVHWKKNTIARLVFLFFLLFLSVQYRRRGIWWGDVVCKKERKKKIPPDILILQYIIIIWYKNEMKL